MKKHSLLLLLVIPFFLLSCGKDEASLFVGTYSYKLSGSIDLQPEGASQGTESFPVSLSNEDGMLEIVEIGKDQVQMTFTILFGDVYTAIGSVWDNNITIKGDGKPISLSVGAVAKGKVSIKGSGTLVDPIMTVPMKYSGTVTMLDQPFNIVDSNVTLVATKSQ